MAQRTQAHPVDTAELAALAEQARTIDVAIRDLLERYERFQRRYRSGAYVHDPDAQFGVDDRALRLRLDELMSSLNAIEDRVQWTLRRSEPVGSWLPASPDPGYLDEP